MATLDLAYAALGCLLLLTTLGAYFPWLGGVNLGPPLALASLILMLAWPLFVTLGVLLTLLVAHQGGLAHLPGQIGLVLHGVSWALLAGYLLLSYRSRPLLDGEPVDDDEFRVALLPSLTMRTAAMADVDVRKDIVFREVGGLRLRVDIYRPRHGTSPLPAAVYIHGGGWVIGSRRQSRFMMYELAAAGWVVFAISYRFAPRYPLPAAIHDCKAGVAWVHAHGKEYGADSERLVVLGGSAGGHLAAMMALTANDARFQPGFEDADTRVSGAVVLYGVTDLEHLVTGKPGSGTARFMERVVFGARYADDPAPFRLVSPTTYVSDKAPPVLLVHGRNDGLVLPEQSQRLYQVLRKAKARVHLLDIPYALHAFELMPNPLHQRAMRVIIRFMNSLLTRSPPSAGAGA